MPPPPVLGQPQLKANPALVDKRTLDSKPETIIANLDRSLFVFSKKQIIVPSPGITEFYTIHLKFPLTDDNTQISMVIDAPENPSNSERETPDSVTGYSPEPGRTSQLSGFSSGQIQEKSSQATVLICPRKFIFTKKQQKAHVSIQIINETAKERLQDKQFKITHTTASRNFDYHRLNLPMAIYRLGSSYIDIVSVGQDDTLQLGTEDTLNQMTNKDQFDNDRKKDLGEGPHAYRNRFESVSYKYLQDRQQELDQEKSRLQNLNRNAELSQAQDAQSLIQQNQIEAQELQKQIKITNSDLVSNFISISNGQTHTVAVKQNGRIFSWGLGICGQMGQSVDSINKLQRQYFGFTMHSPEKKDMLQMSKQKSTNTNLSGPSRLDYDENLKIAHQMIMDHKQWIPCVPIPCPIVDTKIQFKQVSCGSHHTVAVTNEGKVYGCGLSTKGRLGLSTGQIESLTPTEPRNVTNIYEFVPIPIIADVSGQSVKIAQAHCGSDFTLLLTVEGTLLSAGSGQNGIHCNQRSQNYSNNQDLGHSGGFTLSPMTVDGSDQYAIDAGSIVDESIAYDRVNFQPISQNFFGNQLITFVSTGEHHAAVININGDLWTWGTNYHGQCGINNADIIPVPIQPLQGQKVSIVACGGKHSLALTATNKVFSWGNNQYGQLGLGLDEFESFHTPKEVFFFKEKIVSWLGAGSNHSLALSIEGYCFQWGRNDRGQLGVGSQLSVKSDSKISCPKIIDGTLGIGVAFASCNYNQTYLGCAEKLKNKPDTDVFYAWKGKLKKHEERCQIQASQDYRQFKRQLAKKQPQYLREDQNQSFDKRSSNNASNQKMYQVPQQNIHQPSMNTQANYNVNEKKSMALPVEHHAEKSKTQSNFNREKQHHAPAVIKNEGFQQNFENQIKNVPGKNELYEYFLDKNLESMSQIEQSPETMLISTNAFRKYGYQGIGIFHTYVSQLPFRGHDQTVVEDKPPNRQNVLNELTKNSNNTTLVPKEIRHEQITEAMLKSNPFVFGLNAAKMKDVQNESKQNFGTISRLPRNFDLFNRRTEFPYDTIENPMRLNPTTGGEYD